MASKCERERAKAGEEEGSRLSLPPARCSTVPYRPAFRQACCHGKVYETYAPRDMGRGRVRYFNVVGAGDG